MHVISAIALPDTVTSVKPKEQRFRHWRAVLILLPFVLLLTVFSLAPSAWLIVNSLKVDGDWSLANFSDILGSGFYRQAFGNSLWISVCSSLAGLALALVTAASLRRVDCTLRDITVAFTNMTANLSGVPLAFAFIIVMGTNGAVTLLLRKAGWLGGFDLYSQTGLILIYTYFQIPLALLLLYPAFDALDDDWQDAAALLGASRLTYWRCIGLPVLMPALLGTFVLLLANALGAYATAYALMSSNYNLVTIRISSLVVGDISLEPNLAAALSLMLTAMLVLVVLVNQYLLGKNRAK